MTLSKYILAICLFLLIIPACRKKRDLSYTGPAVLEFTNPLTGVNSKTTGQSIGGASSIGGDENIPIRGDLDSVIIQLIGKPLNEDLIISYTVTGGTAAAGTDYEIIGIPGQVVLPAKSSATSVKLRLLNTGSAVKTLQLELTGTDKSEIRPSANLKSFTVNIFPMKAFLNRIIPSGGFFSSRTGETYTAAEAAATPSLIDISFVSTAGNNTLSAPASLEPTLVDSRFSARVFAPAATVPANLIQSYATLQLHSVTNATIAAIPVSGTTATAAINPAVTVVEDGVYGFVGADGKKGYIRVKDITNTGIVIDIMSQP